MNKLTIIYSILILGILVNIFWLFSESDKNDFVIESVYTLEQNNTQDYLEYKDKQTRIEFQYPENWYINQLSSNMIVITPFFDYYLPSFKDYYFDYVDFNKLKEELQKRSKTLDNLSLGIESLLGFDKNSSAFNNLVLDGIISIPGEYEQIQSLTIDNHTAYKIIRPQVVHIALEVEDTPSNQVFHILIFVQDTKNIDQFITSGIEKIISSFKISKPFVIENILSIDKNLIAHNEVQNISIYTIDKYYNKTLPYTNAFIKITYPTGFELDIPNTTISTDENGRFYYEWAIPENAVSGKYIISVTTDKENYTGSTESNFFYVAYKEKILLRLEVENIDISDLYNKQLNVDFKLINPNTEKITVNQINFSVYEADFKLLSAVYDKKPKEFKNGGTSSSEANTSLFEGEEENNEVIRVYVIIENSELSYQMRHIWDSMSKIYLQGKSLNFIIKGTFSYNPYPDIIEIENKEEFNLQYTANKLQ